MRNPNTRKRRKPRNPSNLKFKFCVMLWKQDVLCRFSITELELGIFSKFGIFVVHFGKIER